MKLKTAASFKGEIALYIHIGQNSVVTDKEIIGIFDLESTTVSKITRDYLKINEKKKNVYYVSAEMPRSFVVCEGRRIFVSHLSSGTVARRMLDVRF